MPSPIVNNIMAFLFLKELIKPWNQTDAFKLGIVDENGKLLRHYSDLPFNEKQAYTYFHRLIYNIKRLIEKIPGGKTRIGTWAAALLLLREQVEDQVAFEEDFEEVLDVRPMLNESYEEPVGWMCPMEVTTIAPVLGELDIVPAATKLIVEGIADVKFGRSVLMANTKEYGKVLLTLEDISSMPGSNSTSAATKQSDIPTEPTRFAGHAVFEVPTDYFMKCRHGKNRYHKWSTYVGEENECGKSIREFGQANPDESIVVKDKQTGYMMYLRRK